MDTREVLTSQTLAGLEMLKRAIAACPADLWNDPGDSTRTWQIAYHALFYTHLYVQESLETFKAWSKHREGYHDLGQNPYLTAESVEPYTVDEALEYLAFCQEQVRVRLNEADLEAASGFHWLPFNKLELQVYTIRHIQQHAGELMERLGKRAGIELGWVGAVPF